MSQTLNHRRILRITPRREVHCDPNLAGARYEPTQLQDVGREKGEGSVRAVLFGFALIWSFVIAIIVSQAWRR